MNLFRRHLFSTIWLFVYFSWWSFGSYHLVSTKGSEIVCRNDFVGILFISIVSFVLYNLILLFLIITEKNKRLDYFKFLIIVYVISISNTVFLKIVN